MDRDLIDIIVPDLYILNYFTTHFSLISQADDEFFYVIHGFMIYLRDL